MQPQINENSSLINKNWTDNSTLNEIVKYEYQKSNKTEFENTHLDLLYNQGLKFLGDWKKLTKEEKKIYPHGLKHLLDEKAGIESENVSLQKNKMAKGRDTNRGKVLSLQQDIKNNCNTSYFTTLSDYLLRFFGSINLESDSGKNQHLQGNLRNMSVELASIDSNIYICNNFDKNSLRKRK
jgi:hypothetical protein